MVEFDFDKILDDEPKKVTVVAETVEKHPVVEEELVKKKTPKPEPPKQNPGANISDKVLVMLQHLLKDQNFVDMKYMERATVANILELIQELESNDGKLTGGTKSRDGFVLHDCPKHSFCPIHICVDCEYWKGGRRPSGYCNYDRDIERRPEYDELKKYKYDEAKVDEIGFRRAKGRYFVD